MLIRLAWASSISRRHSLFLAVLTIALCVALILGVDKVRQEVRESFSRSVSGVDLIVGARGGELQLLLYSIFHIGQAAQNISWQSYQLIKQQSTVGWAEPVLLGDSHKGFRVVGTTEGFFTHVRVGKAQPLMMREGRAFEQLYEVVLGAEVARQLGYRLGNELILSHGMGHTSFTQHKDKPFVVSGILSPTGTPIDRSLFVSDQAITAIHLGWQPGGKAVSAVPPDDLIPKEVTAVLVGMKSKPAVFALQRKINRYKKEPLQAVLPGVALHQLWGLIQVAENALLVVSAALVLAGFTGMLSTLLTGLAARQREITVLRMLGARPWQVIAVLVIESALVTLAGIVLGYLLALVGIWLAAPWLTEFYGLFIHPVIGWQHGHLLAWLLLLGACVGIWPGIRAYSSPLRGNNLG